MQSTIAFNWTRHSILSWFNCLTKSLSMYYFSFIRSSLFLTAWLWALLTLPTWKYNFSFWFQSLNPFVIIVPPPPYLPTSCLNRQQYKQNTVSLSILYSNQYLFLYHLDINRWGFPEKYDIGKSWRSGWQGPFVK